MFLAHSFRLRDPWQCERRASGALCWSRVFHRPTGLEPDDAFWLVCSLLPSGAIVTMNGQRLTPGATGVPPVPPPAARNEFEVTLLLADANKVEIEIPSDPLPTAHRPPPTPFPYDIRLGVVGHS